MSPAGSSLRDILRGILFGTLVQRARGRRPLVLGAAAALLTLASCHPVPGPDKTFTGAVLGAGWGAGAGAIIGHQTGHAPHGAGFGAAFGAASGMLTGIGLDITEGTELEQQRELDALKVQVAANYRSLAAVQDDLDNRDRLFSAGGLAAEQIFFDSNRAAVRAGTAVRLQRLAESLKRNPHLGTVEVHGHSDDTGDTERNMRLSEARARTVATFLANQGISFGQIGVYAHGATRPLASNESESGRQLNRRVEIVPRP